MRREPENVLATLQLNPRVFHGLYGIRLITYRFEHKRKVHERSTSSVPQSLRHCITGFRIMYSSAEISPRANRSLRISSAEPSRSPRREDRSLVTPHAATARRPAK